MESLLASGLVMPIGLAIAFWLITSKRFRKQNGEVVSQYVTSNLKGLANSAKMSNQLAFQEFKEELKEYGISAEQAADELKTWENK
jgi:hypothetical protein